MPENVWAVNLPTDEKLKLHEISLAPVYIFIFIFICFYNLKTKHKTWSFKLYVHNVWYTRYQN